jgi:sugar/nucleoside kinase (ribokinase family)
VARTIDVVHLGSASRDLTEDDPRGWRLGGGVTYAALTTARLGLATAAAIGLDPVATSAWELDLLRDAGVDVRPIELSAGPVFANEERPTGRVQVAHDVGVPLPDAVAPRAWATAGAWSIVPVAGELPDGASRWAPEGAFLAFGWQGLLRSLRAGQRVRRRAPRPDATLARADLVSMSRNDVEATVELEQLAGLLRDGTRLAITDGALGGVLVRVGDGGTVARQSYPAIPVAGEVDATGAGDVFLASLLAAILGSDRGDGWPTMRQLTFAAAAASLAVTAPGLLGVPDDAAAVRRAAASVAPACD